MIVGYNSNKSITCLALGLYFAILPFDFLEIGSVGSVTRIVAIVPIILAVIENGTKITIKKNLIVFWLIVLLCIAGASCFYSINIEYTIPAFTTLSLNVIMIILLGATRTYNEEEKKYLTKCIVLGSWLSIIMVLVFGSMQYGRTTIGIGETYQDPNYLCGYMMFALVYHMNGFLYERKLRHLVLITIIFLAVILTGSRGALLAVVICSISCLFLIGRETGHRMKRLLYAALGVLIVYLILSRYIMAEVDELILIRFTKSYLMEKGSTGRIDVWLNLLNQFADNNIFRQLFGNGYGTTVLVNSAGIHAGKVAHNLYIDTLTTLGVFGCFSIVALHISCVKVCVSKRSNVMLLCTMLGFIVMCMSMSLTSYKPLWATMILILIYSNKAASLR